LQVEAELRKRHQTYATLAMTRDYEPPKEPQRFEIGDEVIGDEHIRGTIIGTVN
jgi:hypothetical protein